MVSTLLLLRHDQAFVRGSQSCIFNSHLGSVFFCVCACVRYLLILLNLYDCSNSKANSNLPPYLFVNVSAGKYNYNDDDERVRFFVFMLLFRL